MRKIIIDTDTGSDDAVAILMALRDPSVQVLAVTTVCGNVNMEQATVNAFRSIDAAQTYVPPVHQGAYRPLMRNAVTAENVHGRDGMGDIGLPVPDMLPEKEHAVEAILRLVRENPGEVEIVTLGPATNLALAIMKDPEAMKLVKHIYSMGSGGYGMGNVTSVAEFNVFVDAEAYKVMVEFAVPKTLVGIDICWLPGAFFEEEEIEAIRSEGPVSKFAMDCNEALIEYSRRVRGRRKLDLPDPYAMGVALWPEIVTEAHDCYCYVCTDQTPAYGQVIVDHHKFQAVDKSKLPRHAPNARVIKSVDTSLFKQRLRAALKTETVTG